MTFMTPILRTMAAHAVLAIVSTAVAEPAKLGVCASCHGVDGSGAGFENVPIIAGTPAAHLEEALYAYVDGARRCIEEPLMCETAKSLTDSEIQELTEHYAAMPRVSSGEPYDTTLAAAGERIHQEYCAKCHVPPDDEDVEFALGIPLHGQRAAYLRLALAAYANGDRYTLVPAMGLNLDLLQPGDIEALINYYASYEP